MMVLDVTGIAAGDGRLHVCGREGDEVEGLKGLTLVWYTGCSFIYFGFGPGWWMGFVVGCFCVDWILVFWVKYQQGSVCIIS
jgi:hypothetical protein